MKITVIRSGGFAGLRRTWVVRVEEQDDPDAWRGLIDELPWDDRPRVPPQPDRYVYLIRVSRRRITLPEQRLQGPWRELVDRVCTAAQPANESADGGQRATGRPSDSPPANGAAG